MPGGVADFLESQLQPGLESDDDSIPKGGAVERYHDAFSKGLKEANILDIGPLLGEYLEEAGFVDIHVTVRKLPLGPWAKDRAKKVSSDGTSLTTYADLTLRKSDVGDSELPSLD